MSNDLHETLTELYQKLQPLGPIATIVQRMVKALLQPDETILIPFYQLELDESGARFGSCDLRLITTGRYLELGFYPGYHQFNIKQVHAISTFDVLNRFSTGYEGEGDATTAEERGFNPLEMQVQVYFVDARHEQVAHWEQEASRPDDIKALYKQIPVLSKLVGKPLASFKG